jgi:hypothetical protein
MWGILLDKKRAAYIPEKAEELSILSDTKLKVSGTF